MELLEKGKKWVHMHIKLTVVNSAVVMVFETFGLTSCLHAWKIEGLRFDYLYAGVS